MPDALLTGLQPDDLLLIFGAPDANGRRRAHRIAWATVQDFVLSRQSIVAGPRGPAGPVGAAGKDAASLLGTITIGETIPVAILAGIRRIIVTTPPAWGVAAGQSLVALPTAVPNGAYAVHDAIVTAANTISVGVSVPALAIGATYSIPCKMHRLNA